MKNSIENRGDCSQSIFVPFVVLDTFSRPAAAGWKNTRTDEERQQPPVREPSVRVFPFGTTVKKGNVSRTGLKLPTPSGLDTILIAYRLKKSLDLTGK